MHRLPGQSPLAGFLRAGGALILRAAPWLMKGLTVLGTVAMFLVGGGILAHGWHAAGQWMAQVSALAGALAPVLAVVLDGLLGVLAGALALLLVLAAGRVKSKIYKK